MIPRGYDADALGFGGGTDPKGAPAPQIEQPLLTPNGPEPPAGGYTTPRIDPPLLTPYFPGQGDTPQGGALVAPPQPEVLVTPYGPDGGQSPGSASSGLQTMAPYLSQIVNPQGGQPGDITFGGNPPRGVMPGQFPQTGLGTGNGGGAQLPGNPQAPRTPDVQSASGLPTPDAIASTAPRPLQDFGGLPTVNPTYAQGARMDPVYAQAATAFASGYDPAMTGAAQTSAAMVNPAQNDAYLRQYENLLGTAMAPQFAAQQEQEQEQLAARGISSSGAGQYLTNQLLGQQSSALAAATEPLVGQGYSYTQADIAANQANRQQTGMFNAGNRQQSNLANQGASNTAGQFNAGNRQQTGLFNAGNRQQTNLANQQAGMTAGSTNASYDQQARLANQSYANAASNTNAQYYNEALTGNANAYNNYLNMLYGSAQGLTGSELAAYLNSYGPNTGVESMMNTGLAGTQNAYANVYGGALQLQGQALGAAGQAVAAGAGG